MNENYNKKLGILIRFVEKFKQFYKDKEANYQTSVFVKWYLISKLKSQKQKLLIQKVKPSISSSNMNNKGFILKLFCRILCRRELISTRLQIIISFYKLISYKKNKNTILKLKKQNIVKKLIKNIIMKKLWIWNSLRNKILIKLNKNLIIEINLINLNIKEILNKEKKILENQKFFELEVRNILN